MCLRCSQVKQSVLSKELVGTILREYKIMHAEVILKEDCSEDDFIDVLEGPLAPASALCMLMCLIAS